MRSRASSIRRVVSSSARTVPANWFTSFSAWVQAASHSASALTVSTPMTTARSAANVSVGVPARASSFPACRWWRSGVAELVGRLGLPRIHRDSMPRAVSCRAG
jgi:hypothetical protein